MAAKECTSYSANNCGMHCPNSAPVSSVSLPCESLIGDAGKNGIESSRVQMLGAGAMYVAGSSGEQEESFAAVDASQRPRLRYAFVLPASHVT